MKKITHGARVNREGIIILEGWDNKVDEFCSKNYGKHAEISIEAISGVAFHRHKYYRGTLLPDITAAMGEVSQLHVHEMVLKHEFLHRCCSAFEDIPKKHLSRCRFMLDNDGEIFGYIPSMSTITDDEAKEYIKQCEHRLFVDLASHIGVSAMDKIQEHNNNKVAYEREMKKA